MAPPLTSQVACTGKVVEHVLEELVTKNTDFHGKPLLVFGPCDDAANADSPSIYWAPIKEDWSPGERLGQAGEPGMLFVREVSVSFTVFGGVLPEGTYSETEAPFHDCDLTEELISKLVNSLQRNLSMQGYRIAGIQWFNGGRTGIGMAAEQVVLLRLPLIREDNPTVRITTAKTNAEIATP
jgi:hypothetical protein